MNLFQKIFGTYSEREIKKIIKQVDKAESLEETMRSLSDIELKNKTDEFKDRLGRGESLDDILPEAFALVREAADRVLGLRPYRVQLIGGIILHQGRIAEMKTGEGKTLVATLPAYLNALEGKGVHIVTVNDYLAKRDRENMGKLYEFLGLSVGVVVHGLKSDERKKAYQADITYGTNNEFGFDYLRDNMVIYKEERVQRELNYAIVDEVDSILIDEARTPLIISGRGDESTDLYKRADSFVRTLTSRVLDVSESTKRDPFDREIKEETVDYLIDEKAKSASLTDKGVAKAEAYFSIDNLSDLENMEISHHIHQALKARSIMKRDIDYVEENGEIVIVDEFTGRMMYGRRYSDGLHQAIEAKEGLEVKSESKTLATITFQNYFRMFKKLSGMTGTAMTEDGEFREIYGMDVVEIPTNEPVIRIDEPDSVYRFEKGKFKAIVEDIKTRHATGQPILVGTVTIEKSEELSRLLKEARIEHEVLNAKHHAREAEIVAQAGRLGSVTIATNMAGRGTDIMLGGNPEHLAKEELKRQGFLEEAISYADGFYPGDDPDILKARELYQELYKKYKIETDQESKKVVEAGGLYIIGTERHESRRIDNQLRGRSGRQGDPGGSKFYISLEDDLMRLFGGETLSNMVDKLNMEEDEALEHRMLTRAIENAQKRVEGNNFAIRKHVLQYDDVMNKQREVIYNERRRVLEGENLRDHIMNMIDNLINSYLDQYLAETGQDIEGLLIQLDNVFSIKGQDLKDLDSQKLDREKLYQAISTKAREIYQAREEDFGEELFREVERVVLLQVVDSKWMDHIDAMDQLKQGIGLRAYGQVDPVRAYQVEGFEMFEAMTYSVAEDTIKLLFNLAKPEKMERKRVAQPSETGGDKGSRTVVRKRRKVGRNEPCPCGSGKKYKHCCGR